MATNCVRSTVCPELEDERRLYTDLQFLGIDYVTEEHQAVFTVAESCDLHHRLSGTHSKNLFLKDNDNRFWLVTVPADIRVNLKALPAVMESKRLSFGKADDLLRLLRLMPGSVTPLGAINDIEQAVMIVLDREIAQSQRLWIHPLRNTASLGLSGDGLTQALSHWQHRPLIVDVPRLVQSGSA